MKSIQLRVVCKLQVRSIHDDLGHRPRCDEDLLQHELLCDQETRASLLSQVE